MKISFLLIMVTVLSAYATSIFSQNATVSVNMQNVTVREVVGEIEKQGGISFLFNDNLAELNRRVSVSFEDTPIKDVLENALSQADMMYEEIKDNFVVLISKPDYINQQDITIRGRVTDAATGDPLPGASIVIRGTTIGVATGIDGDYTIRVPGPESVLLFTYVGYISREVVVGESTVLNISLNEEVRLIDEIVVIGYGTLDKREVTSSITHISGSQLANVGSTNLLMRLQGRVAGLNIQNLAPANPNASTNIQLRGVTTRSGATSPLIVIDGVPGGSIETINENDIESIDILKDGAASAIYGTRASNGVIIITTKRGSEGVDHLSYNVYTSFDFPTMEKKPMSTADFLKYNRGENWGSDTDWLDVTTNEFAFTQKHTASFSGGARNTFYRATIDYQDASGYDIVSKRQQYGARLNINHSSASGLYDFSVNVAPRAIRADYVNQAIFDMAIKLNPTAPIMVGPDEYYHFTGHAEYNPVEELKLRENGAEIKFLDWNALFKLNILRGLSTQIQVAQLNRNVFNYSYEPSFMTTQIFQGFRGTGSRSYSNSENYSAEWLSNYLVEHNKHFLRFMGVVSYQYFQDTGISANNRDFPSDAMTYNNLGSGTYNQVAGRTGFGTSKSDSKLLSFRGRANYSYESKYLLSASITRDGSSKFGEFNKWGNFIGLSVGWNLASESFMSSLDWINEFKLRADYGETGNQDAISNYQSLARYSQQGYYLYDGVYESVWGPANNINPNLRWEMLKNWNIGVDFRLFNNRFSGSINYFNKKAVDLLGTYDVPQPPAILPTSVVNVGSMVSNGLEFELDGIIFMGNNFSYNISLNGATQNSVFVSFSDDIYKGQDYLDQVGLPAPGSPGTVQRLQEGKRLGMFYFWEYAGVDENGTGMVYNKEGVPVVGLAAAQDDKKFLGNGQPKFIGSMYHQFSYKDWDASILFRGAFGYDIFNIHEFYYGLQGAAFNHNVFASAYNENVHITDVFRTPTDYFLENGTYVKLDVVQVAYTFRSISNFIESVRLYGTTRNLLTFTGFTGVDPELYPINGLNPGVVGNRNFYPSTTQFLIGLQVNF